MTRPTTAPPFDPVVAGEVALLADHLNAAYPDTVTLVARWALAADEISSAAIVAVDPAGLDLENRTADIWVVLHGGAGTIGGWAAGDVVGQPIALWGPRGQFALPDGTTSLLLVCDETALGAVAAIIDDTDPRLPVHVVAEVADAWHAVDLPGGPRTTVTWVFRGHDEPGTGTRLLDVVRDLDLDADGVFAFGAAEARQIMAVRRHLRNERSLPAAQVDMGGYWRRDG